jgi:AbrB family looped-hinge helix DNA binding protein
MKPIGVIKTVDNAGRLIIPSEIRERLGLFGEVELIMTDEGLLVRKYGEKSDFGEKIAQALDKNT